MTDNADKALREALAPVVELDAALAAKEGQLRTELESVKLERQKLTKVLRVLSPERPQPGPRGKSRTVGVRTAPYAIAEKHVESIRELIAATWPDGEEFNTQEIFERWGAGGAEHTRKDKVNKALGRLRERGQVRMVAALRGRGGGSVYVATPRIEERHPEIASVGNGA